MATNTANFFSSKSLRALYVIWYREILLYWRNKIKVFTSIFLPVLIAVAFGTGLGSILEFRHLPYNFSQFLYPGILGLSISVMSITSTLSIVWDREYGFLREILVAPVSRSVIAWGKILGASTVALIEGILLLFTAPYFNLVLSPLQIGETFLVIIIFTLGVAGLGVFLTSFVSRTESFSLLLQLFIAPMSFLSGGFFPLNSLPLWLQNLARFNPLAYGIDALRWTILSGNLSASQISTFTLHSLPSCIIALLIFDFIIILLAFRAFKK